MPKYDLNNRVEPVEFACQSPSSTPEPFRFGPGTGTWGSQLFPLGSYNCINIYIPAYHIGVVTAVPVAGNADLFMNTRSSKLYARPSEYTITWRPFPGNDVKFANESKTVGKEILVHWPRFSNDRDYNVLIANHNPYPGIYDISFHTVDLKTHAANAIESFARTYAATYVARESINAALDDSLYEDAAKTAVDLAGAGAEDFYRLLGQQPTLANFLSAVGRTATQYYIPPAQIFFSMWQSVDEEIYKHYN